MSPIALDPAISAAVPAVLKESKALLAQENSETSFKVVYDDFLSEESKGRYPSPLKDIALLYLVSLPSVPTRRTEDSVKYLSIPGIISFGGGMPHPDTFPVNGIKFSLPYAKQEVFVGGYKNADASVQYTQAFSSQDPDMEIDLAQALQYGGSGGAPQLVKFLTKYTAETYKIPYSEWSVMVTGGNTDGVDNISRMLCNRGDSILMEEFSYPGSLAAFLPQGVKPVPVSMDGEGMCPKAMDKVLSGWDDSKGRKPKVVLLVPTGQNPGGYSMSLQRKKDFYAVARKHNIIIISDDPYRALVLHYPKTQGPTPPPPVHSFLEIDVDGRVLDLTTFSKVVAPGCRCGWVVGPTPLIKKLILRNEVSLQAVSGFSVAGITSFLGALGGTAGWAEYLKTVAANYSVRANVQNDAFQKHLPLGEEDLCSYQVPTAGMFMFIRIHAENHPRLAELGPEGVLNDVFLTAIDEGVVLSPSTVFKTDADWAVSPKDVYVRTSFSYVDMDQFDEGARRFGRAIRKSFGKL